MRLNLKHQLSYRFALAILLIGTVILGNNCTGFLGAVDPSKLSLSSVTAKQAQAISGAPLVVQADSHIVVMQYETWFGPNGQHFEGQTAKPLLSSASMKAAGLIGYDSADPLIIQQHAAWLKAMDVDAVEVDLSNAAACTFNTDINQFCNGSQAWKNSLLAIRANLANLYSEYNHQNIALKIIPLLDGQDPNDFVVAADGSSAFEKQVRFFANLASQFPNQQVIYEGKPLISVYSGVPSNPNFVAQVNQILHATGLDQVFTVRFQTGFNESQSSLWINDRALAGLHQSADQWAWVERLRPELGLLPTYVSRNGRVESFTVTSAFPGSTGWGNAATKTVATDAGVRGNGEIFKRYMAYAKTLSPTFLFIDQFNEYMANDQGFSADTTNDLEPTDLWANGPMDMVTSEIAAFRASVATAQTYIVGPGFFMVSGSGTVFNSNGISSFCGFKSSSDFTAAGGASDYSNVLRNVSSVPLAMHNDGFCASSGSATSVATASNPANLVEPAGFFMLNGSGTVYNSNGIGHICSFANFATFVSDGGAYDESNVRKESAYVKGTIYDGSCVGKPMAAGFFRIVNQSTVFISNGLGQYCGLTSTAQLVAAGGHANQDNVTAVDGIVTGMQDNGLCY